MRQSSNALNQEATLWRHTLYWAAGTLIAAILLWTVGEPWLMARFGTGAPWWAYGLLCTRLAYGLAQMWKQDVALRKEWRDSQEASGSAVASAAPDQRDCEPSSPGLSHGA